VAEHSGRLVHQQAGGIRTAVGALGVDDALIVEQAALLECLEVAQAVGRERAEDVAARVEDPALGITERPGLQPGGRVRGGYAAEK
jgi:hypothetical protein